MSGSQVLSLYAAGLALILGFLLARDEHEIDTLKRRIAALEKRTAPLAKLCGEDDYYEAFFRLMQEACEKK